MDSKSIVLTLFSAVSFPATLLGAEPELATRLLLTKWESASTEARIVDSRFVRLTYSHSWQSQEPQHGRFYWELPNRGCYLIEGGAQLVWNGDFTFVDPIARTYLRRTAAEGEIARRQVQAVESMSRWQSFVHVFSLVGSGAFDASHEIDDLLPLCTAIDADAVQKRYEIRWREEEGKIRIAAEPKKARERKKIQEIELILDRRSLAVQAYRMVDRAGTEVVHIFEDTLLNASAKDRAQLLSPNLDGFTIRPLLYLELP